MEITIKPYTKEYDNSLLALGVADEQLPYIGFVKDLLNNRKDGWMYQVIFSDDTIVGLFNVDENYGTQYDFADQNDIGFRAFFIDKNYQGMGIGSGVVKQLKPYVRSLYPNRKHLVLTVNCKNNKAYSLYTKYGFVDNGELYYGGSAGSQYILRMDLEK